MTVGAFAGWLTVYIGGDLWFGVIVAALAGAAFGFLHAVLTVPLGLSQHVTGIGITLLATSMTYYTYRLVFPEVTSPPKIEPFAPWAVPGLSDLPFVGEALFRQTPLTYLAFIVVAVGRLVSLQDAGRTGPAHGGRKSGRRRGARHRCHPCADGRGDGRKRADGDRRRLPHHVGLQFLLFRHGQRPRLDRHRARRLRIMAAGQGACSGRSCSARSMPINCDCSNWQGHSFPIRSF